MIPCEIGDILYTDFAPQGWYLREDDKPYAVECVFIGINNLEEFGNGFVNVKYIKNGNMLQFNFSDFGKNIFKNKENTTMKGENNMKNNFSVRSGLAPEKQPPNPPKAEDKEFNDDEYIDINYETISVDKKRKLSELYSSSLLNAFTEEDYYKAIALLYDAIDRVEN